MEMKSGEIARRYRAGRENKEDIIEILSQLNACSRWNIIQILLSEGISEQTIGIKYIEKAKKKYEVDMQKQRSENGRRKSEGQEKETATKKRMKVQPVEKAVKRTATKKNEKTAQKMPDKKDDQRINEMAKKLDEIEMKMRMIRRQREKLNAEMKRAEEEYLSICKEFGIKGTRKE